eukprot:TRINITY_DN11090_c0_g1_i1.p1 TRINITY_DN11090_c0_g1~~TRINITY_DN11090_c0_g1_i1.p1  ORF type:complete len:259 (+),score=84.67 TRINITY_DN11090_c0_g1_i1:106-777(+)
MSKKEDPDSDDEDLSLADFVDEEEVGDGKKAKKSGLLFRAKKNVTGKVATSALGASTIKKSIPREMRDLLIAFLKIVEKAYDSKSKSKELERDMIRIMVKAFLQADKKNITMKDWLAADQPLRHAFNLVSKLYDYYGDDVKKPPNFDAAFLKVEGFLTEVREKLSAMLKPYMREKNVQKLDSIFETVGTAKFLRLVWATEGIKEELWELVYAMIKYTEFEYDQ